MHETEDKDWIEFHQQLYRWLESIEQIVKEMYVCNYKVNDYIDDFNIIQLEAIRDSLNSSIDTTFLIEIDRIQYKNRLDKLEERIKQLEDRGNK